MIVAYFSLYFNTYRHVYRKASQYKNNIFGRFKFSVCRVLNNELFSRFLSQNI